MSPAATSPKRPVRIAGCSGGFTDRVRALASLAADPDVDAVIGDWLSEMTMTVHGSGKVRNAGRAAAATTLAERQATAMYAETFLQCFEPAIDRLARHGAKLAVNAGASDTELLARVCRRMIADKGYADRLKVAWVEGDDVTDQVNRLSAGGERFESLMHGRALEEWGLEPVCAQAYLGGLGIAEALRRGADVVICGRVADAAPVVGVAAWWHGWAPDRFDELAGALVAGHLIECSAYVTGGYYSGFKDLMRSGKHVNMGFPIAEVDYKGECVIAKEKDSGGCVTVATVTSQLVYEIQGPWYYNCDVVADLQGITMEQLGEDRVRVSGVKGLPPPPTTKVGITAPAGFQAEWHIYLCGLDMAEKCAATEAQVRHAIGEENLARFTTLKFHQNGTSPIDAASQDLATVDFRIFAQARDPDLLRPDVPQGFNRWVLELFLQSVPGASLSNDLRQTAPKPYYEYWVSLLPQAELRHRVHLLFGDDEAAIDMPPPNQTRTYPRQQPSYETRDPVPPDSWGETARAPLGHVVLARSGDKASDCNVGFFVRHDDEWDWLRGLLTVDKVKELLGPHEYKGNKPIDRFEIPGVRAVHFLLHDHLDRGYNASSSYDTLGKLAAEYLRAKTVDIPKRFLDRGRI